MERKIFKSERNSQIIISKKFDIKKGDVIEVEYITLEGETKPTMADVFINKEKVGRFDFQELEEFLTIFFQNPID